MCACIYLLSLEPSICAGGCPEGNLALIFTPRACLGKWRDACLRTGRRAGVCVCIPTLSGTIRPLSRLSKRDGCPTLASTLCSFGPGLLWSSNFPIPFPTCRSRGGSCFRPRYSRQCAMPCALCHAIGQSIGHASSQVMPGHGASPSAGTSELLTIFDLSAPNTHGHIEPTVAFTINHCG